MAIFTIIIKHMCYGEWWVWLAIGKWLFKKVDGLVVKMVKGWRGYGIRYRCGKPLLAMVVFSLFKDRFFFFSKLQWCLTRWGSKILFVLFCFVFSFSSFFPNNTTHNSIFVIFATKTKHATTTHLMRFIMPWVLYYLKFRD